MSEEAILDIPDLADMICKGRKDPVNGQDGSTRIMATMEPPQLKPKLPAKTCYPWSTDANYVGIPLSCLHH